MIPTDQRIGHLVRTHGGAILGLASEPEAAPNWTDPTGRRCVLWPQVANSRSQVRASIRPISYLLHGWGIPHVASEDWSINELRYAVGDSVPTRQYKPVWLFKDGEAHRLSFALELDVVEEFPSPDFVSWQGGAFGTYLRPEEPVQIELQERPLRWVAKLPRSAVVMDSHYGITSLGAVEHGWPISDGEQDNWILYSLEPSELEVERAWRVSPVELRLDAPIDLAAVGIRNVRAVVAGKWVSVHYDAPFDGTSFANEVSTTLSLANIRDGKVTQLFCPEELANPYGQTALLVRDRRLWLRGGSYNPNRLYCYSGHEHLSHLDLFWTTSRVTG